MWTMIPGGVRLQFQRLNGVVLHYQVIPAKPEKPKLVFANALGTDFRIWRDVVVRLAGDYAILLYDKRGHGLSGLGEPPYTVPVLGADLAALIEHTGFSGAIVVGLSIGGLIAQELVKSRPDLVRALVFCDTAHKIGTAETWTERIAQVRAGGMAAVADGLMQRWFGPEFRASNATDVEGYKTMVLRCDVEGYLGAVAAIRDADYTEDARRITKPALCIVGEHDVPTPPSLVAEFAKMIPGARFELITGAGHIPSVDKPEVLAEMIRAFTTVAGAAKNAA
jgi:3-oxoadipate enol-lactonase